MALTIVDEMLREPDDPFRFHKYFAKFLNSLRICFDDETLTDDLAVAAETCIEVSVQCTVYSVQCTMYSVQCTVYNVQCTMYTLAKGKALVWGQDPLELRGVYKGIYIYNTWWMLNIRVSWFASGVNRVHGAT